MGVMGRALSWFLRRVIKQGALRVHFADGRFEDFGDGSVPRIVVALKDRAAEWALLANPELALGELYMDARLVVERGDVYDLLALGAANARDNAHPAAFRALSSLREAKARFTPANDRRRARSNVAHHYDLDQRLYRLFLDADMQYSCAYFESWETTLDEAQLAKKRHLAAKLLIEPGQRVLDIGCGFGGLSLYLARVCGARVTGVTLSNEQYALARERVEAAGLSERIDIRMQDYRDVEGTFDRIVSVGMFEHVGKAGFDEFFNHVKRLLCDDGVALLHAIGRSDTSKPVGDWVAKYIFPGGYLPPVSEVSSAVERQGLLTSDIEVLRLHYAQTLKLWRERFRRRWADAASLYDERFCRMWDYYLAGAECGFRILNQMVFQFQLSKKQGLLPATRDYIVAAEAALRARELERSKPLLAAE